MAKASVRRQVVREPVSRRRVVLVLTEGEADFLINMCYRVRGDIRLSPVKYAVRIRIALQKAVGYNWASCDARHLSAGAVRFTTYEHLLPRKLHEIQARQSVSVEAFTETASTAAATAYTTGGVAMGPPSVSHPRQPECDDAVSHPDDLPPIQRLLARIRGKH